MLLDNFESVDYSLNIWNDENLFERKSNLPKLVQNFAQIPLNYYQILKISPKQ